MPTHTEGVAYVDIGELESRNHGPQFMNGGGGRGGFENQEELVYSKQQVTFQGGGMGVGDPGAPMGAGGIGRCGGGEGMFPLQRNYSDHGYIDRNISE